MKTCSILALAVMALWAGSANAKYSGGTGEPNDPYRIARAEDLNDIGNYEEDWGKQFILVNDVNLAEYTGTQFKIIGRFPTKFTGVFDGNNCKIWNFTWTSTDRTEIGLFGCVGTGGQIKNLGMENVDVNVVNGYYVSGLVGYHERGTIINCYSTGSVSGNYNVGGLVGANWDPGTIINCYSTASVLSGTDHIGGLVGGNGGTITNCYSTGSISGEAYVGGLVGHNTGIVSYGRIINCYSTGVVNGYAHVGGLLGGGGGLVTASFWDTQTSGQLKSAGGTGKTTGEMKTMSTFTDTGWDFVEIWGIGQNQTYPFLRTEPAGDLDHDKKVDLIDLAVLASHWLEGP